MTLNEFIEKYGLTLEFERVMERPDLTSKQRRERAKQEVEYGPRVDFKIKVTARRR